MQGGGSPQLEWPRESRPPGRVLVVDDELAVLEIYRRVLRAAGHIVETASNGNEAAVLIRTEGFDVIVSDIILPGIGGMELLQIARQMDADLPFVLVTGKPDVETATRALEYGALRYLVKPFEETVLQDLVVQALRLRKLAKLRRRAMDLLTEDNSNTSLATLSANLDRTLSELWIAYQPIVSHSAKKVVGYEALLRSDETSLPHPRAIFDAATRLDRLDDVGRQVRDRIAKEIHACPAPPVYVNLHTRDLTDDSLFSASAPLSRVARNVVFEITERSALDAIKDIALRIARLRELGYRIAVDDLGAGYAGLSSFAQLEPDVVKFDTSLVRDVHRLPRKQRLVSHMVQLFSEMGLQVIAEGVEVPDERDALAGVGCDLQQGYLFARPGPGFPEPVW